jgi:hypothetical protein
MAGIRKHGAHRFDLSLPALAAGAAADTSNVFPYDAFAEGPGGGVATAYNPPFDVAAEEIFEACFTLEATLTGQATNFSSICLRLIRAAAVLNDIRVVYNAAGVTSAAFTLSNMAIAAGAAVPNTGTGTLTLQTGVVLPWTLQPADIIQLLRLSAGTGQATPAIGASFSTRIKGA